MHSPFTFADTGKALLLALLDMHELHSESAVQTSPYRSLSRLRLWLQRQVQLEAAEKLFLLAYKTHGYSAEMRQALSRRGVGTVAGGVLTAAATPSAVATRKGSTSSNNQFHNNNNNQRDDHESVGDVQRVSHAQGGGEVADRSSSLSSCLSAVMHSLRLEEYPNSMTLRGSKFLPALTLKQVSSFVPPQVSVPLLAETPATTAPRSLLSDARCTTSATQQPPPPLPAQIRVRPRVN